MLLNDGMTDTEPQRRAHRERAWAYLVLGAIAAWLSFAGIGSEAVGWKAVGVAGLLAGLAAVVYGVRLFQRPSGAPTK